MKKKREGIAAAFFLLPSAAGLMLFYLYPFADTVRRSFFDALCKNFLGWDNYISVLGNKSFRLAAYNTFRFLAICIPLLLAFSLALAILMRGIQPGGRRLKTLYLLPMAIPVASIMLLWQLLFEKNGLINAVVSQWGIESIDFMGSGRAFWVLVGSYMWKNLGYNMVLWMAGLDGIPQSLYEAARVDGAGEVRCFFSITIPCLLPTAAMVAVISLLNGFKVFREAYLVAGSYPHDSIYLMQHLFNNWFVSMDISRLCCAAVLLCLGLLTVILPGLKVLSADVD